MNRRVSFAEKSGFIPRTLRGKLDSALFNRMIAAFLWLGAPAIFFLKKVPVFQ